MYATTRALPLLVAAGMLAGCLSGAPARHAETGMTQAERIDELERRVQRLDNLTDSGQLLELMERVDTLHDELRQLRGDVEQLGHDGESLSRRQRELYLDLDRRLQNLETGGRPAGGAATGDGASAPVARPALGGAPGTTVVPGNGTDTGAQRREYDVAYRMLIEGRYPVAIDAFQNYLKANPDGQFADNAQYWLGEAFYVSRDFPTALAEFQKVVEQFPRSSKVPDAMLKIGYTQYELQRWDDARRALSEVVERAPGTTVARLAQDRLDRMRQEGR